MFVGPGFVSTSPAFMRSSSSSSVSAWPACPPPPKKKHSKSGPYCWGGSFDTLCTAVCDSSTACRLFRLEARIIHTGVPQGSMLSPTLFSIYIADIPRPTEPVRRICYADDNRVGFRSQNLGTTVKRQHLFDGDVPVLKGKNCH